MQRHHTSISCCNLVKALQQSRRPEWHSNCTRRKVGHKVDDFAGLCFMCPNALLELTKQTLALVLAADGVEDRGCNTVGFRCDVVGNHDAWLIYISFIQKTKSSKVGPALLEGPRTVQSWLVEV